MSGGGICILALISCYLWVESLTQGSPSLRIAGGNPVNITEVPFMARYYVQHMSRENGAAIVHESFLLSCAFYCYLSKLLKSKSHVTVGTDQTYSGGEQHVVKECYIHPDYNLNIGMRDYDVSIIKVAKPLKFNERVKPIQMATKDFMLPEGAVLDTMGFGNLNRHDLSVADHLRKISVPVMDYKKCQTMYKRMTERMICAGILGKGACDNDDGGSLTYKNTLVGIVASEVFCVQKDIPAIYAYIPAMRDFIDSTIKTNA